MAISGSTDAADRGATDGPPDLATALSKLIDGNFDQASLPITRASNIWGEIKIECNLTLGELSALQNEFCSGSRGILPRIRDSTMYKIHDECIHAHFTISTDRYIMPAELLVDSGAETELKLPARKVLKLGLHRRHGPRSISRGSTNNTSEMLVFSPVLVKATFTRDGVDETVEADLAVKCEKDDYERLESLVASGAAALSSPASSPGGDSYTTPPTGQEPNFADSEAHAANNSNPIRRIRVSPVRRRPNIAPLEQAVIGIQGLKKLGLHLNCELQQLEIEDEVLDDGES